MTLRERVDAMARKYAAAHEPVSPEEVVADLTTILEGGEVEGGRPGAADDDDDGEGK